MYIICRDAKLAGFACPRLQCMTLTRPKTCRVIMDVNEGTGTEPLINFYMLLLVN